MTRSAPTAAAPPQSAYREALNQAKTLVAGKQMKAGVAAYKKAAKLKPSAKGPHQALCRLLPGVGEREQALSHCKRWRAMERSPGAKKAADRMIARLSR